ESESAPEKQKRRLKHAEATYQLQRLDAAWADPARKRLQQGMSQISLPGVSVQNVECRETLCKIEFSTLDSEAGQRTLGLCLKKGVWDGSGMAVHEDRADGSAHVYMYLAKSGSNVPDAEIYPTERTE